MVESCSWWEYRWTKVLQYVYSTNMKGLPQCTGIYMKVSLTKIVFTLSERIKCAHWSRAMVDEGTDDVASNWTQIAKHSLENLKKCRNFPINRNQQVCEMSTSTFVRNYRLTRQLVSEPHSWGNGETFSCEASQARNTPFPSCLLPLFSNKSSCKNVVWFAWKWTYRQNAYSWKPVAVQTPFVIGSRNNT